MAAEEEKEEVDEERKKQNVTLNGERSVCVHKRIIKRRNQNSI